MINVSLSGDLGDLENAINEEIKKGTLKIVKEKLASILAEVESDPNGRFEVKAGKESNSISVVPVGFSPELTAKIEALFAQ